MSIALLWPGCPRKVADRDLANYKLRTLSTAKEAHSLSTSEAIRGYPIHLRGVVTYSDRYLDRRQTAMFVHDATGSIFLALPSNVVPINGKPTHPGTLVDVRGVSAMGDFAPIIAQPRVTAIGTSHLPPRAVPVSLTRLLTGKEDGQWVEVEAVILSVFEAEHIGNPRLSVAKPWCSCYCPFLVIRSPSASASLRQT